MFKKILSTLCFLILGAHFACASMSTDDKNQLTNYAPWTSQFESGKGFGNVIYGYIGITGGGSVIVNYAGGVVPVTLKTLKLLYTSSPVGTTSMTLADGVEGQKLNLTLTTLGGTAVVITPKTAFGFKDVKLSAAGQGCTFIFADSTTGWVPDGCYANSASVQPLLEQ